MFKGPLRPLYIQDRSIGRLPCHKGSFISEEFLNLGGVRRRGSKSPRELVGSQKIMKRRALGIVEILKQTVQLRSILQRQNDPCVERMSRD